MGDAMVQSKPAREALANETDWTQQYWRLHWRLLSMTAHVATLSQIDASTRDAPSDVRLRSICDTICGARQNRLDAGSSDHHPFYTSVAVRCSIKAA